MPATLVTDADLHDIAAAGEWLERAAAAGRIPRRVEVDGISAGAPMRQAAEPHGVGVQVTTRDRDTRGFKPLPLRWRIEGTFGTLTDRYRRLTRSLKQSAAVEDAVTIANRHRPLRAINS